jgi:hypothetical protein
VTGIEMGCAVGAVAFLAWQGLALYRRWRMVLRIEAQGRAHRDWIERHKAEGRG